MTKITINLPFPPSVNELWRSNRGRVHISNVYKAWKTDAGWTFKTQKGIGAITGPFKAHLTLNREMRGQKDLDNRAKAPLDFCKAHGIIVDDKYCEAILARWGSAKEAPLGARLILRKC